MRIYDANKCRPEDFINMESGDVVENATHGGRLKVVENYGQAVQKVEIMTDPDGRFPPGTVCLWTADGLWKNPDYGEPEES